MPNTLPGWFFYAVRQIGLSAAILLALVIFYLLRDEGILRGQPSQAVELLKAQIASEATARKEQERLLAEQTKALTALSENVAALTKAFEASGKARDTAVLKMWCYALAKDAKNCVADLTAPAR